MKASLLQHAGQRPLSVDEIAAGRAERRQRHVEAERAERRAQAVARSAQGATGSHCRGGVHGEYGYGAAATSVWSAQADDPVEMPEAPSSSIARCCAAAGGARARSGPRRS